MIQNIHGHEIIDLVSRNPDGLSLAQLTEAVAKQFGASPRFFTCSAQDMNLAELLEFLAARDKIRIEGESVYPGKAPACNH
jgi:probable metal-binding protein